MRSTETSDGTSVERDAVLVDGIRRTFTVLGDRDAAAPRSLVLVLHGSKQTADAHRRFTGDALAPLTRRGAVVAYLDGHRGNWNDARRESSFPARLAGMDDVAFVRAVVDRLAATHGVDPHRTVLVGFSNGGQMVLRLLHEAPEVAAAAVIVAATMPAPESFLAVEPEPPARPIPVALMHGTRDRIAPFEGGTMSGWARAVFKVGGRTLSAHETIALLAARNGITAEPDATVVRPAAGGGGPEVVRTRYRQAGLPDAVLYEVRGGGHTIPGAHPSPRLLGRTATDVTLVDVVAEALAAIAPAS